MADRLTWPTPLLPVAWTTATVSYSSRCRTPPPSTVGDECRGTPGCQGQEVGHHYADDSLWDFTLAPGSRTNRLHALSSSLQVSSPARRRVPRVDDHSNFGSVDASPPTVCRSRWPCSTEDQNRRLRSSKFLSRWSVTVEYSAVWHETVVSTYCTVLQPAKDSHVRPKLLRMSSAVIILDYYTCATHK